MKNLWIFAVLAFILGFVPAEAKNNGNNGMVEIRALARSQGFVSNLVVDPPVTCYAKKATRTYNGNKIQYQNAVFILMSQLQNKGQLFVSAETKCTQEYWNTKAYPPTQWQFFNFHNHYPTLYQGGQWDSMIRSEDLSWCRVLRLELVHKKWGLDSFDYSSYRKVVIHISPEDGFSFINKFLPQYSFAEYFLSKDVRCFMSKEEALRGGFKLLE